VAAVLIYIHVWNDRGLPRWNLDHFNNFFKLESAHELSLLKNATAKLPTLIQAAKVGRVRMSSTMNAAIIRVLSSSAIFFSQFCATFVDFSILS
jgi:hypothetical protein